MISFRSCVFSSVLIGSSFLLSPVAAAIEGAKLSLPFFTLTYNSRVTSTQEPFPCPGVLIKTPEGFIKGLLARTCIPDSGNDLSEEKIQLITDSGEMIPLHTKLTSDSPLISLSLASIYEQYIFVSIPPNKVPNIQPASFNQIRTSDDYNPVEVIFLDNNTQSNLFFFAGVYTLTNPVPPPAGRLVITRTQSDKITVIGITNDNPNDVSIITPPPTTFIPALMRQLRQAEFKGSDSGEDLSITIIPVSTLFQIASTQAEQPSSTGVPIISSSTQTPDFGSGDTPVTEESGAPSSAVAPTSTELLSMPVSTSTTTALTSTTPSPAPTSTQVASLDSSNIPFTDSSAVEPLSTEAPAISASAPPTVVLTSVAPSSSSPASTQVTSFGSSDIPFTESSVEPSSAATPISTEILSSSPFVLQISSTPTPIPASTPATVASTSATSPSIPVTTVHSPVTAATSTTPTEPSRTSTTAAFSSLATLTSGSIITTSSSPVPPPPAVEQEGVNLAGIVSPTTVIGGILALYTVTGIVTNTVSYGGYSDSKALRWTARLGLFGISAAIEACYFYTNSTQQIYATCGGKDLEMQRLKDD